MTSNPAIEVPSIEEIKKLVTFTRTDGEWRVNTVEGSVEGSVGGAVFGNVGGAVFGNVGGAVFGDVKGDVGGDVEGYVEGNVEGNVWGYVGGNVEGSVKGTINGRKWSYELTLKERIQDAIKAGDTDLASKLLESAEITAKG
jgi:hypothetical protein